MEGTTYADSPVGPLISALQGFFDLIAGNLSFFFLILAGLAMLALARRIPILRTIVSLVSWLAVAALLFAVLRQQGMLNPDFASWAKKLDIDRQEVVGGEVRIKLARDGHYWANVTLNGFEKRMLVDSGATVTALSAETARAAGVKPGLGEVPVLINTANGTVSARTGTVKALKLGPVHARNLTVIVSPSLGNFDVLGMNFLSRLKSWRVEDGVLILVPKAATKKA